MGNEHRPDDADGPDRFADDPAFAVHEGGKLAVRPTRGAHVNRRASSGSAAMALDTRATPGV